MKMERVMGGIRGRVKAGKNGRYIGGIRGREKRDGYGLEKRKGLRVG